MNYSDIESLIETCFNEIEVASRDRYDSEKAEKTAALFLMAQMKLSFLIEEVEMKARGAKNEISRIEGEKYFEYKTSNVDKKITENMLVNYIAKDPDIVKIKLECAKHDSTLKKWNYILNVLKDSHIFYRNLTKNKTWAE